MNPILSAKELKFQDIITYPEIIIKQNCTTMICGESGCGKSTLLKLFNATVVPSQGVITYNGQNILEMNTLGLRKEVSLVSQTVFLFNGTIAENFNEYYTYREMIPLSEDKMKQYLSLCCADFDLSTHCETMSGGERQRVFIAICLSFMPKVLMLDEPTSALDGETAYRFFENLKDFCVQNEMTLVAISHDQRLVDQFADQKIILERR